MKQRGSIDSVGLICGIAVIVLFFGTFISCSHYYSEAKELKAQIDREQASNENLKQEYLKRVDAIEEVYREREKAANEKFEQDLQQISINSDTNKQLLDQLHNSTAETIKHLPDMERSACTEQLKTKSEQLERGATLLEVVDSIARQYDAELEKCLSSWPAPITVSINNESDSELNN